MSFQSSLTQTCSIQRLTGVKDTHGNVKDVWGDVATGVPCRVSSRGMTPRVVNLQGKTQTITFTPIVYMSYRTDVKQNDRLAIDGDYYRVLLALNVANKNHHLTITTELIRG